MDGKEVVLLGTRVEHTFQESGIVTAKDDNFVWIKFDGEGNRALARKFSYENEHLTYCTAEGNWVSLHPRGTTAPSRGLPKEMALSAYLSYEGNESIFDAVFDEDKEAELSRQFDAFCIKTGQVVVGCNPAYVPDALRRLKESSCASPEDKLRVGKNKYQSERRKESHGIWANLFIPDPRIDKVDERLGLFLNARRLAKLGLYQISKLSYVFRLFSKGINVLKIDQRLVPTG